MTKKHHTSPEDAFYVGDILVEVYDEGFSSGYKAATANEDVVGVADLGFEISVRAFHEYEDDPDKAATALEAIDRLRYPLARCCVFGRMQLIKEMATAEDWEIVEKVWDELPEDYFEITPALTAEACRRQTHRDERGAEVIDKIICFMGEEGLRRRLNKEERAKMTLGEALEEPDAEK